MYNWPFLHFDQKVFDNFVVAWEILPGDIFGPDHFTLNIFDPINDKKEK